MRLLQIGVLGLLLLTLSSPTPRLQAQETEADDDFRVALVIETRDGIETATTTNIGDDGITRYNDMLRSIGITVEQISLDEPVPPEIDAIILIGPRQALGAARTSFLWNFLVEGGHLLLALDPLGHNRTNTEREVQGISQLLQTYYGMNLTDSLLIEDWFSFDTLSNVTQSWSTAQVETIFPHPITEPLQTYDLPLRFWGGRNLNVDAVTGYAATEALLRIEGPYGETDRINFLRAEDASLIELNVDQDLQGRFLLASIATNYETGSRVALLGDSEMFQNIYGQTRVPGLDETPRYPGTFLFVQRLTAWLVGLPEDQWPDLPDGFTWLALDGDADDWPDNTPLTTNPTQPSGTLGIEAVSAFRNDQFVYLRVDATQMLPMGAQVRISALDSNGEAQVIVASSRSVFSRDALVTDAAAVFGEVAELRLPRRLFNVNQPQLTQICVQPTPLTLPSCFDAPVTPQLRSERDPSPLRGPDGPQAFVTNGANLRVAPDTEADLIANLPSRELLEIVGRDTSGEWLFVRNGRYEGWMAAFLLVINADIDTLNIIG